jgi:hypothetical protein
MQTTLIREGRVTISRDVRQHFWLKQGMTVTLEIGGDYIALRPARAPRQRQASGFGLIKSRRMGVLVDFDVGGSLKAHPGVA